MSFSGNKKEEKKSGEKNFLSSELIKKETTEVKFLCKQIAYKNNKGCI